MSVRTQRVGTRRSSIAKLSIALTQAMALAACGGGGGNGSNSGGQTPGGPTPGGGSVASPTIASLPQDQTAIEGDQVQFSVTASGSALSYQWRQNDVDIAGANAATLTLANVTRDQDGARFRVLVSNSAGSSLSSSATLTVQAAQAPTIGTQPAALALGEGDQASFTVAASGLPQPSYQWRRDGQPVPGATSATYSLGPVQFGDSGASFDVVVTNRAGSVTSAAAVLTVARTNSPNAPAIVAAGGDHTCMVTKAGVVYCWGSNSDGQLGVAGDSRATPVSVAGIKVATRTGAIVAGSKHTCAVTQDSGLVYCWGDNASGQLGNGTTLDSVQPGVVNGLSGVSSLAATDNGMCALVGAAGSAEVWCWGRRVTPDASTGPALPRISTTAVREDDRVQNALLLAGGGNHYCVANGKVRCWGQNFSSELGRERSTPVTTADLYVPSGAAAEVAIGDTSTALGLALGSGFSCALVDGETPSATTPGGVGPVKCWGTNLKGQLGVVGGVLESAQPFTAQYGAVVGGSILIPTGTLYASVIAAGANHSCAVADDSRVHCWGNNESLQMGFTPPDSGVFGLTGAGVRRVPTGLESTDVVSLAAGGDHTCALSRTGGIKCWGRNDSGQLGRAAGEPLTAADVEGLPAL